MAREDTPRVKPHPDHALALLMRLGVAPGAALLVGDHPLDIETARRAGVFSAAVLSGHASREDLAAANPDFLAEDCPALIASLRGSGQLP